MANELISSYIDLAAIRKETDLFLEQISLLKKAKDELSKTKANLKIASNNKEIIEATNATVKAFNEANKAQDAFAQQSVNVTNAQKAAAKATKEATAETEKQVGAYDRLKKQFADADKEAKNLAAEFGVTSEQAIKASASAAALKEQLAQINALSKTGGAPKIEEVPFTHNLNEDGTVKEADLSKSTQAVNELNKAEAELTNTATAMGNSNLKAGDDIKTTATSTEQANTALQELNGTIAQNVKVYNDYQNELKAVKAEQKAIEAAIKEAGVESEQDIQRKIQLGIRERELKVASSELNRTINAQTKELQAAEGSYDMMNQQLGQMRDAFRQLSEAERNSAFGQELQGRIQITDEAIKQLDANIGNFQRNVGNYKGSFAEPFKLLQSELEIIKEKLRDPALTGKSLQSLQKEEALLTKLTENLSKEFPNLTKEVRAITNASNALGAELGEDSSLFLKFAEAAGTAADSQKDLQARVNFNASDTKHLDAIIGAVNGLAGAYSAAEGAAQLFGDGNEDIQRGMQKLQALIAITTGLQQVQNALQSESAAMQGILAAKTALLTAAMHVQNLITGENVVAIQAEAAAHIENAAAIEAEQAAAESGSVLGVASDDIDILDAATQAQEQLTGVQEAAASVEEGLTTVTEVSTAATGANTVATEENTAAEEQNGIAKLVTAGRIALLNAARKLQSFFTTQTAVAVEAEAIANTHAATSAAAATVSLEAETAATVETTAATTGLTTAIAVGLLGAFAAVGAAIYFAFKKLGDWIVGSQKSVEEQGKLLDLIKSTNDALLEQANILAQQTASQKSFYETQLSLASAAGANAYKQFAIRKQIAKEEADLAQQQIDLLGANNKEQARLLTTIEKANNSRLRASETLTNELSKDADDQDERLIKSAQGIIELNDKIIAANKPLYDAGQKARQDLMDANKAGVQNDIEEAKFSADERRKLILENASLEADLVKSKNADILNDEKSNLSQRLAAIKSNAAAEKAVIEAQKNDVLNNPSSTPIDRSIAVKKAAEEEKKVTIATNRELFNIREDDRKRNLVANKTILELGVQAEIDANDKIVENEQLSLETRLNSLNKSFQDRKTLIDAEYEYNKELNKNKNATYAEEELLEKDHEAKLSALAITTSAKVRDITLKDIDARKAGLETLRNDEIAFYNQVNALRNVKPATDHANEILELNKLLQTRKIGIDQYNQQREKLDRDYNVSQLENAIQNDKDLIDIAKQYGADDYDLQKKLADDLVALDDAKHAKLIENRQKLGEKEKEIAQAGFDLLTTIGDAGFTTELNRIQDLIDKNDEYYGREIENTKNSTLSAQEKADRTTLLEAEQAAKRTQLEKKQRDEQVKQAKFDRDAQVLSIMGNAIAAHFTLIKQLGVAGIPLAIANDILAGIQIAALLAKPLPKFFKGKFDNYEGPAIVGDGGRPEVILRKDGSTELTPNTSTLAWIGKDDKVFPDVKSYTSTLSTRQTDRVISNSTLKYDPNKEIITAYRQSTSQIVSALRKMPAPKVNFYNNGDFNEWVKVNVRGRR